MTESTALERSVSAKNQLPKNWILMQLSDVRLDKSKVIIPNKMPSQSFELYSVPSFDAGEPEIKKGKEIGSSKLIVEEGTTLLCKINPRINRVWNVGNHSPWLKIASTEWIPFFNREEIDSDYLCFFLSSPSFRNFLASNASGVGGSLMRVKASTFSGYPFPLAPLSEQRRIAFRIKQIFKRLDLGVYNLGSIKAQLKRYRLSVLKHAFEGKLTEHWRSTHKDKIENATRFFEQITQHERTNEKSADRVSAESLGRLPSGWLWARLGSLARVMDVDHKMPKNVNEGLLFISPKDFVHPDSIDFGHAKQISEQDFNRLSRKCKPETGDIIYSRIGARLGRARKVPRGIEFQISYSLCLVRPHSLLQETDFFYWLMKSPLIYEQALAKTRSIGVPDLGLGDIKSFLTPFPSMNEQFVIAELVERYLSIADNVRRSIEYNLKKTEQLKQAVLKTSFEGGLVPQEASDEPADLLLQRIRKAKPKKKIDEKTTRETVFVQRDLTGYVD